MLGLGVAFIATPILGLFGFDLKNVIMPWSLWLNGLTAIAGAITFARAGMVDWRTAIPLLIITTIVAPVGVWLLQFVSVDVLWWIYVGVLVFLAFRMAFPPKMDDSKALEISDKTRVKAGFFAGLIGIFAGFLGVGPGFLMMPTLVMVGYTARIAAFPSPTTLTSNFDRSNSRRNTSCRSGSSSTMSTRLVFMLAPATCARVRRGRPTKSRKAGVAGGHYGP